MGKWESNGDDVFQTHDGSNEADGPKDHSEDGDDFAALLEAASTTETGNPHLVRSPSLSLSDSEMAENISGVPFRVAGNCLCTAEFPVTLNGTSDISSTDVEVAI